MPVPSPVPLQVMRVNGTVSNVSSTSVAYLGAPFAGRVIQVGATIGAAIATADATCTTNINGAANPITGGAFTLTSTASAAGNSFTATPSAANYVNANDGIGFVFSGTGTAGGSVVLWADIRRGN